MFALLSFAAPGQHYQSKFHAYVPQANVFANYETGGVLASLASFAGGVATHTFRDGASRKRPKDVCGLTDTLCSFPCAGNQFHPEACSVTQTREFACALVVAWRLQWCRPSPDQVFKCNRHPRTDFLQPGRIYKCERGWLFCVSCAATLDGFEKHSACTGLGMNAIIGTHPNVSNV